MTKILAITLLPLLIACSAGEAVNTAYRKPFSGQIKKQEAPQRYLSDEGEYFFPYEMPIVKEKDQFEDGWRYDIDEWIEIKSLRGIGRPYYYEHPDSGSNNGIEIG